VPRIRFQGRRRCAIRIIAFARSVHDMGRTQAAILRISLSIQRIQALWRDVAAIRREQRGVLLAQLQRAEARLLRTNARKCALCNLLLHGGPHVCGSTLDAVMSRKGSTQTACEACHIQAVNVQKKKRLGHLQCAPECTGCRNAQADAAAVSNLRGRAASAARARAPSTAGARPQTAAPGGRLSVFAAAPGGRTSAFSAAPRSSMMHAAERDAAEAEGAAVQMPVLTLSAMTAALPERFKVRNRDRAQHQR
jgi:hypothetical protein